MNDNPTILIIEDDHDLRLLIHLALSTEGYHVIEAVHGQQALDHLQHATPDLIFLDMNMPVMNGWTFLMYYLRMSEDHAPIIASSAQVINPQHIPGITAFLAKPFDLFQLKQVIAANVARPARV